MKDLHLWRNTDDPQEIFLLFEVADAAEAKAFAASPELKEKMAAAGVMGPPDIFFLLDDQGGDI